MGLAHILCEVLHVARVHGGVQVHGDKSVPDLGPVGAPGGATLEAKQVDLDHSSGATQRLGALMSGSSLVFLGRGWLETTGVVEVDVAQAGAWVPLVWQLAATTSPHGCSLGLCLPICGVSAGFPSLAGPLPTSSKVEGDA